MAALPRFALLFAIALLAGCGKPSAPTDAVTVPDPDAVVATPEPPPHAGSCLNQAIGVCQDFDGTGHSGEAIESTCTGQNLRYDRGACPLKDRIGSCLLFDAQPITSRLRYYGGFALGADGARQQCEQKLAGRWLPG